MKNLAMKWNLNISLAFFIYLLPDLNQSIYLIAAHLSNSSSTISLTLIYLPPAHIFNFIHCALCMGLNMQGSRKPIFLISGILDN